MSCDRIYPLWFLVLVFLVGGLAMPLAWAGVTEHPYVPGEVILKFAKSAPTGEVNSILADLGATRVSSFPSIGASLERIDKTTVVEAVSRYENHPLIEYIEPNYIYTMDGIPNDPSFDLLWGMHNTGQSGGTLDADIDAPEAWDIFAGSEDVIVAVIDSGVDYNHPDLAGNIWTNPGEIPNNGLDDDNNGFVDDIHGWDFYNGDSNPMDDNGHGTHCSGTIGAVGDNSVGVAGVNWTVNIMALKFLSAGGSGPGSAAISCIEYATMMGVDVMSNSWGGGPYDPALEAAIQAAHDAGILFVASAGNAGVDNDIYPHYPSSYEVTNVIAVGATDHNDERVIVPGVWASNYGLESVDLGAPGLDIYSTMPAGGYAYKGGTSMATPHVSGTLALVRGRFPGITVEAAKTLLFNAADPVPALSGLWVTGGRLNAHRALSGPDSIPPDPVADLFVDEIASNWLTLQWTATGDDGMEGTASFYDLRFATFPIDTTNFYTATEIPNPPAPSPSGQPDSLLVSGLNFSTLYYFAMRVGDEYGNLSELSNVAEATTLGEPDIDVDPSSLSENLITGAVATQSFTISNNGPGTLDFTIPDPTLILPLGKVTTHAYERLSKDEPDPRVGNPVLTGFGGPDMFGYTWKDSDEPGGPTFAWLEIGSIGSVAISSGVDVSAGPFPIGFDFNFYGETFETFNVCSNGFLSFTSSSTAYINQQIPNPSAPPYLIAPFWDDLDVSTGNVYYHSDGSRLVVQWDNVQPYSGSGAYTFEIVFYPDGQIVYQYLSMTGPTNSSTVGIQNGDGSDGLQVAFNTDYVHNNLAVRFQTLPPWLSVNPVAGSIVPGSNQLVEVTFDAADLCSGTYDGIIDIHSNDPDEPVTSVSAQLTVTGQPDIVLSEEEIVFGAQFIGTTQPTLLVVANAGCDLLNITDISVSEADFSLDTTPFDLLPGAFQELEVSFTPSSEGEISGSITISSNDPDEPSVTVTLNGIGVVPPVIIVSPDSLYADLITGETSVQALTISNSGGYDLDFSLTIEDLRAGTTAKSIKLSTGKRLNNPPVLPLASAGHQSVGSYDQDRMPARATYTPAVLTFANLQSADLNLLLLTSGGDPYEIQSLLMAFPDISIVDILDVSYGTPTLEELLPYHTVLLMNSTAISNPVAVGDVLADYVDAGGGVVQTLASFVSGWGIQGRFLTDGYTAFDIGMGPMGSANLGDYDPVHPIMEGVTSAWGDVLATAPLAPGAVWVASWNDGENFVATQGTQVVGVNIFVAAAGYWMGDIPLLLHNAAFWAAGSARWLSTEPRDGTVAPGSALDVMVTFDASGLCSGQFDAAILIANNDPLTPEITVPAHMQVTGEPEIALSDTTFNYGQVFIGATVTDTLIVSNTGCDLLSITNVSSDHTDFSAIPATFDLAVGESQDVVVSFSPSSVAVITASLTIESNDPDEPLITVTLEGEGVTAPVISIAPDSLFADLLTGETESQNLTISNNGGSDLIWETHVFQQAATKRQHYTLSVPPANPQSPEGEGTAVEVKPQPRRQEPLAALLSDLTDVQVLYDLGHGQTGLYDWSGIVADLTARGATITENYDPITSILLADYDILWITDCYDVWTSVEQTAIANWVWSGGGLVLEGDNDATVPAYNDILTAIGAGITYSTSDGMGGITSNIYPHQTTEGVSSIHLNSPIGHLSTVVEPAALLVDDQAGMSNSAYCQVSLGRIVAMADENFSDYSLSSADNQLFSNQVFDWLAAGVGWLNIEPTSGVLPAGADVDVEVTFDATQICGGDYLADLVILNNDPLAPEVTVPAHLHVTGEPDIAVSDTLLAYGQVFIGAVVTDTLVVSNPGCDLLTITGISSDFGDFSVTPASFDLAVGESQDVLVDFSPTSAAVITASLTIASNDPDEPVVTVILTGEGLVPPEISVFPDSLYADLWTGEVDTQTVTITNSGGADLEWAIDIEGVSFGSVTFTKDDYADWTLPENQDRITDNVWITRANVQGIFNAAAESSYSYFSPLDTEWAYGFTEDLQPEDYQIWRDAVFGYPPGMVGQPISLHLISDDLYFDVEFHSWTSMGNGGGFSYTRTAVVPSWLVLSQDSGTVPAGGSVDIDVTFSASELCGGDYLADLWLSNNDPLAPEIRIPAHMHVTGEPDIAISDTTFHFGQVFIGATVTDTLVVSNPGCDLLTVTNISSDHTDFTVSPASFDLVVGEDQSVLVSFSPTSAAVMAAALTIESNDPDQPTLTVALTGEGVVPPEISVAPDSLYADLLTGESETQIVTITNSGGSDLIWEAVPTFVGSDFVLAKSPVFGPGLVLTETKAEATAPPPRPTVEQIHMAQIHTATSAEDRSGSSSKDLPTIQNQPGPATTSREILTSLEEILSNLNDNYGAVNSLIPNRYDFSEGETGTGISDGGDDMYDGGNYLSTNLGGPLEYSNNMIVGSTIFGAEGRYFTRKYPGLFVLCADLENVDDFEITGNLGADGSGYVDGVVLATAHSGQEYQGFVKRVYDAYDPSVNHLIIIAENPAATHEFSTNTNDDYHRLMNITGSVRLYYLLYAGSGGYYIDDTATLQIMDAFLGAAGLAPAWLAADPNFGTVVPGGSVDVSVTFDATQICGGDYLADLLILNNDPLAPEARVATHLHVTGEPDIAVSDTLLAFGALFIGDSVTDTLVVSSSGCDLLTVTDISSDHGDFSVTPTSFDLPVGESQSVLVTFTPTSAVQLSAMLTIQSNDPDEPIVTVALEGEGLIPPEISVAPDSLFADLLTGETETQIVTIQNNGGSDLNWLSQIESGGAVGTKLYTLNLPDATSVARPDNPDEADDFGQKAAVDPGSRRQKPLSVRLADLTGTAIMWDLSHAQSSPFGWSVLIADLTSRGATVSENYAAITDTLLSAYDILISMEGTDNWSPGELSALADWLLAGGSLFLDGDNYAAITAYNSMLSSVGAGIEYEVGGGYYGTTPNVYPHETTDGVTNIFLVSPGAHLSVVVPPAGRLVDDTNHVANSAYSEVGAGRIFTTADDYIFDDYAITLENNQLFVNQVFDWLATGVSWLSVIPEAGTVPAGSSQDVEVTFDATQICGGDYLADFVILNNDPLVPEVRVGTYLHVTGEPDIAVSDTLFSFGSLFIGDSVIDTLVVSNPGCDLLTVTNITSDHDDFSVTPISFDLPVDESQGVLITFTPSSASVVTGSLSIHSNDPDEPIVTVILEGEGLIPPEISVAPDSLYADLLTGETETQIVIVTNSGGSDLNWESQILPTNSAVSQLYTLNVPDPSSVTRRDDPDDPIYPDEYGQKAVVDPGTLRQIPLTSRLADLSGIAIMWDRFHDQSSPYGWSVLIADLTSRGATVTENFSPISSILLDSYDILICMEGLNTWTAAELNALTDWLHTGGSLFLDGDNDSAIIPYNLILSAVGAGIEYGTSNGYYGVTPNIYPHETTHEVANIYLNSPGAHLSVVMPPAGRLVDDANHLANSAYSEVGAGRIFATADDYIFDDYGITYEDNQLFVNQVFDWLATGVRWLSLVPESGMVPAGSSQDVEVTFDAAEICGGDYLADLLILSNDPLAPEVQVATHLHVTGEPDIAVSDTSFTYGQVFIGESVTDTLVVSNFGCDFLTVTDVSSDHGDFVVAPTSFDLLVGESQGVLVSFTPSSAAQLTATLTIQSNDPDEPVVTIALSGEGVFPPEIAVAPDSLYADMLPGQFETQIVTVSNNGQSDLNWESQLQPIGTAGSRRYTLTLPNPSSVARQVDPEDQGQSVPVDPGSFRQVPLEARLADLTGITIMWDRSHSQTSTGSWTIMISDLTSRGATVSQNFSTVTDTLLAEYDILICMEGTNSWTAAELNALTDWLLAGGSLFLDGDNDAAITAYNSMLFSVQAGIEYDLGSGYYGVTSNIYPHETTENVTSVLLNSPGARLSVVVSPAGRLVDDTNHYANSAYSEVGAGRIFATADDYIFDDYTITVADNQLFVNQVFDWLATGVGWLSIVPESGTVAAGTSQDVAVTFTAPNECGGDFLADLLILSNDPVTPEVTVSTHMHLLGEPGIAVSDTTLAFGVVFLGNTETRELTVTNVGCDTLHVTDIFSSHSEFTVDQTNFDLSIGQSQVVTVTFDPTTVGIFDETLQIQSDDLEHPVLIVALEGVGALPPDITVTPDSLTADLLTGDLVTRELVVRNTGGHDLHWFATTEATESNNALTGVPASNSGSSLSDAVGVAAYQTKGTRGSKGINLADLGQGELQMLPHRDPADLSGVSILLDEAHGQFEYIRYSTLRADLIARGATLYFNNSPIDADVLEGWDILWTIDCGDNWTVAELEAVTDWVNAGGSMLLEGDFANSVAAFNTILATLGAGIEYATGLGTGLETTNIYPHIATVDVDTIHIETGVYATLSSVFFPAAVLIEDAGGVANTAYSQVGLGRIVAMADQLGRNQNIIRVDNRVFLNQVFDWLAAEGTWIKPYPDRGTVAAGDSMVVSVDFDARWLCSGEYLADVVFFTNVPDAAEVRVGTALHVTGLPDIGVEPDTLTFAPIFVGATTTNTLVVTNVGCDVLTITGITSDNEDFSASPSSFSLGIDESQAVAVSFSPSMEGLISGNLSIASNDPDEPLLTVPVAGTGIPAPVIVVDPIALHEDLDSGETSTQTLSIQNEGGSDLTFAIVVSQADGSSKSVRPVTAHNSVPTPMFTPTDNTIFYDDMESGVGLWTTEVYGGADLWHHTQLLSHSPTTSWWCGIESQGDYDTGTRVHTAAVTPPVDLRFVSAPVTLEFWESYTTEIGQDRCHVEASGDGGTTWIPLRDPASGYSNGWIATTLDLSEMAGELIQLRFRFDTGQGTNNNYLGWFFDDLHILSDVAPWLTVDTLAGSVPPGENYPVNVTFDATGVPAGEYGVNLVVVSNDPVTPSFSVPVTLTVSDVILSVEIDVTAGVALDEDNVLGSAVNATDGYDPDLDLIEPDPTPNNYVTAYFPHPEWGVPAGERFQTDIRAPFDPLIEERSWPFTVETDQLTTVTFTFTPSFDAASGWGLWLRDETTGETHDLFPALTYQFEPDPGVSRSFTIMVGPQVPLLEPTERLLAADWSLIGAPLVPPDGAGSWADVLLDDAPGAVHLFGYEGLAGYAEVGPEEPVVQGQGLWVAATESFVWTMEGTMDTDGVAVPLLEGWTLVGYPLWLEGNLAGVLVDHAGNLMTYTEAVSAGLVSGSVFDYENTTGGYVPVTDLQTWHGYWFAAYASDLTLQFDFQNMVGSDTTMVAIAAAKNGKDATGSSATGGPTGLSRAVEQAQAKSSSSNWEVTVRMGEGPFAVTFGMNEGATDGFDAAFDLPVPPVSPAGADFPEIVFSRPEWALSTGEKFSRDLISPTNELRLWPATIRRSEPGTVTLSWDSSSWPYERDYQVYLPAENRVVVSSMREQTSVELEITGGSLEVQFRTPGFATDVPWQTVGLNLRNMPNPFNPSTEFHFNLSRDAAVEVRIYNLRGALVRRLVGGVKTAGPVSLRWQGRDDQGAQVASGIYFYQLYLDGRREGHTGKMSLIK